MYLAGRHYMEWPGVCVWGGGVVLRDAHLPSVCNGCYHTGEFPRWRYRPSGVRDVPAAQAQCDAHTGNTSLPP